MYVGALVRHGGRDGVAAAWRDGCSEAAARRRGVASRRLRRCGGKQRLRWFDTVARWAGNTSHTGLWDRDTIERRGA